MPFPGSFTRLRYPAAIALAVWGICGPAFGQSTLALKPAAMRQVTALVQEKISRTPAQRKIDSHLLFELKRRRGDPLVARVPKMRSPVQTAADGTVEVDIQAVVTDGLLRRIEALGGRIINRHPAFNAIRARVPLSRLEIIAGRNEVRAIRAAERPILNKINTSEGDVAHRADVERVSPGSTGAGVKACALSDSVDYLSSVQSSGDLPAVDVLDGQSGTPGSGEGTAMLEIVHDLAPGASLGFATAFGGKAQFAQNILDLAASGCDVIVDDVFYYSEAVFQDGVIAQAVDTVAEGGALYFTSAGNAGNLNDGTAGVWEGTYMPLPAPAALEKYWQSVLDFGGGVNNDEVIGDAPFAITLHWNEPLGGSGSDFDLFLFDAALENVIASSTDFQDGTQDPYEIIDSSGIYDVGKRLVVARFSGSDSNFMHLNTLRGQLDVATTGQIAGHSAAEGAFTVAAVDVATAGGGVFTGGAMNPVETFSSDGPRRVFFDPDGTTVSGATSGVILNGLPSVVRDKPDVAAADGVSTATPGFSIFFGTSAAAPHAAAIGALLRGLYPDISAAGAKQLFQAHALDIEAPGLDRDSGAGILDAKDLADNLIFADGFESGDTSSWFH